MPTRPALPGPLPPPILQFLCRCTFLSLCKDVSLHLVPWEAGWGWETQEWLWKRKLCETPIPVNDTIPSLGVSVAQLCQTLCDPWTVAARLLCPWDFPGKNTGVGCHFLQGIFPTQELNPHLLHPLQWQVDSLLSEPALKREGREAIPLTWRGMWISFSELG